MKYYAQSPKFPFEPNSANNADESIIEGKSNNIFPNYSFVNHNTFMGEYENNPLVAGSKLSDTSRPVPMINGQISNSRPDLFANSNNGYHKNKRFDDEDEHQGVFEQQSLLEMYPIKNENSKLKNMERRAKDENPTPYNNFSQVQSRKKEAQLDFKNQFYENTNQSDNNFFTSTSDNRQLVKSECMSDNENGGSDQNKTSRGLRKLSEKVKEIVQQQKRTTYKEVAETLVEQLQNNQKESRLNDDEIDQDQQNIKRRVYDALNVLIAADVINKRGKNVESTNNTEMIGKCHDKGKWDILKEKEKTFIKKKQEVRQKREQLNNYIKKYIALQQLMQRNAMRETHLNAAPVYSIDNFIARDSQNINIGSQNYGLASQSFSESQQGVGLSQNVTNLQNQKNFKIQFPIIMIQIPTTQNGVKNFRNQNLKQNHFYFVYPHPFSLKFTN